MYFKIEKSGCVEDRGLVQVRFDLFLEEGDYKYLEHYVEVPIFPPEGYRGKIEEGTGRPTDMEYFNKWVSTLPTQWHNNPFCCHFCQFEPNVTDEEILYVGELALDMGYKNWKLDNLTLNKNMPITFSSDNERKIDCEKRVEEIIATNFSAIKTIGTYSVRED